MLPIRTLAGPFVNTPVRVSLVGSRPGFTQAKATANIHLRASLLAAGPSRQKRKRSTIEEDYEEEDEEDEDEE